MRCQHCWRSRTVRRGVCRSCKLRCAWMLKDFPSTQSSFARGKIVYLFLEVPNYFIARYTIHCSAISRKWFSLLLQILTSHSPSTTVYTRVGRKRLRFRYFVAMIPPIGLLLPPRESELSARHSLTAGGKGRLLLTEIDGNGNTSCMHLIY